MIGWKLDDLSDTAKRFYYDQISDDYDNFKKLMRNIWDKLKGRAKNLLAFWIWSDLLIQ